MATIKGWAQILGACEKVEEPARIVEQYQFWVRGRGPITATVRELPDGSFDAWTDWHVTNTLGVKEQARGNGDTPERALETLVTRVTLMEGQWGA